MKHIIPLFTLVAALFAASIQPAKAQQLISGTLLSGTGTNIFALVTNTYNSSTFDIDVRRASVLQFQVFGRPVASNFCKPRFDFRTSLDDSVFTTTNLISVTCLGGLSTNAIGEGTLCYQTNLDVRGLNSLRLYQGANTDHHGGLTNIVLSWQVLR